MHVLKSSQVAGASRLVFTSNGVVVGVVIRRVERYDLVKIKPTESEAEHWFCLCFRRLRSSASRSGRINQCQCSIPPDFAIGWFFRFCLRQPSFHWITSDGIVNGIGRNGNVLILPTPIPDSDSAYDSDFRFSLGHKLSYDSDSVFSENQPFGAILKPFATSRVHTNPHTNL